MGSLYKEKIWGCLLKLIRLLLQSVFFINNVQLLNIHIEFPYNCLQLGLCNNVHWHFPIWFQITLSISKETLQFVLPVRLKCRILGGAWASYEMWRMCHFGSRSVLSSGHDCDSSQWFESFDSAVQKICSADSFIHFSALYGVMPVGGDKSVCFLWVLSESLCHLLDWFVKTTFVRVRNKSFIIICMSAKLIRDSEI